MKTKQIIILTLLAILVSSCCWGVRDTYVALTEAQKQLIPYEKGQVISFINWNGQIADITVTENKVEWSPRMRDGSAFCSTYYKYEIKTVVLKWEASNFFEIRLVLFGPLNFHINIGYGSQSRFSLPFDTEGVPFATNSVSLLDSIEINGKVYYDIVVQKRTNGTPWQLFYNTTYGILQIKMDGRNFLMLNH